MNDDRNLPITSAVYGPRTGSPGKRRPPREHRIRVGYHVNEQVLRRLSRKYRCVRRYLP